MSTKVTAFVLGAARAIAALADEAYQVEVRRLWQVLGAEIFPKCAQANTKLKRKPRVIKQKPAQAAPQPKTFFLNEAHELRSLGPPTLSVPLTKAPDAVPPPVPLRAALPPRPKKPKPEPAVPVAKRHRLDLIKLRVSKVVASPPPAPLPDPDDALLDQDAVEEAFQA